jgi:formylmethanofuran dehydrogenase subunit E
MTSPTLEELLAQSSTLHRHLCPRQVLGVRMGLCAAALLDVPAPQEDKRLLTIVETDGCFSDGIAVALNCWVGRRTLRVEDYGKVAATVVDTHSERAMRLAPHPQARTAAHAYAPEARNKWEAMLLGYQRMPAEHLFTWSEVELVVPVAHLISRAGMRAMCDLCGEEILNERQVVREGATLCRACAEPAYYRQTPGAAHSILHWTTLGIRMPALVP